ncbi:ABC transporter permease [Streptomyces sp. NPDC051569]|uniref:ABC transporter permease n=1 Tax=Streptomyces sp. NPDC051569 TaxID=3365661 RepID=UPI00378F1801
MAKPPSTLHTSPGPPARSADENGAAPPGGAASTTLTLFKPVILALAIGAIFIGVYLAAFHDPRPHGLPVAVVGSAATTDRVEAQLSAESPGSFHIRSLPDTASARSALERGEIFGVYVASGESPRVLYAGARGPSVTSLITSTFDEVAREDGQVATAVDVVPSSPADTRGLVVFYATFGLVLAGYLFGIMTYQLAPRITVGQRLAGLGIFGALGGLTVAAIVHSGFGALPAPFLGIAMLVALVATAVGASTMLLVRRLGVAGSSIAAVVFMTVGNATSGGSLPPDFLPGWLRPLSDVLPVGVGVRAMNGLAYFHHDGLTRALIILPAWILVSGLLLHRLDRSGALRGGRRSTPGV